MNIGIVTTWFERGAAYVSRQLKEVLSAEHQVFIYARGGEHFAIGDSNWDSELVTWGTPADSFAPTDIRIDEFKAWLLDNGIELVIFNEQKIWAPVIACRELGVINGAYIDYYTEKTVPCFHLHDFLICNTLRHRSVFDDHHQVIYIPWGTDIDLFKPAGFSAADPNQVTFFHSAGMSPYRKGTDLLIAAFEPLADRARLFIHSQVELVQALPSMADRVDRLRRCGALTLHEGSVPAPGLYTRGDVYVYPSRLEGIGLTLHEACGSGLPIIVPDNGPMNEFVQRGQNGDVVAVSKLWSRWDGYYWPQCEVDIGDLQRAMSAYVDRFDSVVEWKRDARQYALDHFDWKQNASVLSSRLQRVEPAPAERVGRYYEVARAQDEQQLKRFRLGPRARLVRRVRTRFPRIHRILETGLDQIRSLGRA